MRAQSATPRLFCGVTSARSPSDDHAPKLDLDPTIVAWIMYVFGSRTSVYSEELRERALRADLTSWEHHLDHLVDGVGRGMGNVRNDPESAAKKSCANS